MNNQIQESVEQKFAEIYFSDGMYNNRLISDQVKAEEHKWQFDRFSEYN